LINRTTFLGFLTGLLAAVLGVLLFVLVFSEGGFVESVQLLYQQQKLGGLISIGALINLPLFFICIRKNKIPFATGLVFAALLLVMIIAFLKINI
jgi:hypothetical protein